ncbi:hypothetical protein HUT10_47745 [Amycolatopsis sp. Hca4]|nr:hypothetical protein HUT10_47745 [Amycolatopsis sp. Hca4]
MPFIFCPSRARRATSGMPSSVSHVLCVWQPSWKVNVGRIGGRRGRADKELHPRDVSYPFEVHEQVADGLRHPSLCRVRRSTENADPPARVVDSRENVLPLSSERDGLDEVHRQNRLGLRAQKVSLIPGSASSPWMRR